MTHREPNRGQPSDDAPRVSVVMPAYNAEKYIAKAIRSVFDQTSDDWELIIVNDGSTDRTADVAGGFAGPKIQLVNQANGGAGHARNTGFAHARGRYVALLDADDWYEPQHLERSAGFLDDQPRCSLVGTNYLFIDYKGETTLGCKPGEILGRPGDGLIPDYFRATMRNRCYPITCCALFRRELIPELGGFDPSLPSDEDHDFWTRWAMRTQFGYIDQPLCYYRIDTPNSNRKNLGESIRARVASWRKLTAMESGEIPLRASYERCRSFYLFRLTALAVAMGYVDEVREISRFWPTSPSHIHWWLGRGLAALPDFCIGAIHKTLGQTEFVRHRQGKPAPRETDAT